MVTLLKNSPFTCSPNYPASKISNVLPLIRSSHASQVSRFGLLTTE